MAKKSASKAEKTVNATKKKASAANNTSKSSGKKPAAKKPPAAKKNPKVSTEYENPISNGVTGGIVCMFLFVLFLLILFKTDGALLLVARSVVLGLIGEAGLLFFTPVFGYVGFINLFGRKTAVKLSSSRRIPTVKKSSTCFGRIPTRGGTHRYRSRNGFTRLSAPGMGLRSNLLCLLPIPVSVRLFCLISTWTVMMTERFCPYWREVLNC